MRGNFTSVYIRTSFEVAKPDAIESLYLYVNYDDGFIAYLNGREVASSAVDRIGEELRVRLHEADGYEEFLLKDARQFLVEGRNVLAIEGHNADLRSSDLSLEPFLVRNKIESLDDLIEDVDFLADLDELEKHLLDQSSYLTRRGFDYATALQELRESIDENTELGEFTRGLQKLVMQIGDSHAGVYSRAAWPLRGFLPLRPADTADGLGALNINLDKLLDDTCPYLKAIDGVPIERWLEAAAQYVPQGSPQLIRRRSLEWLGLFTLLREELGVPANETVTIELMSADGSGRIEQVLRLTNQGYAVAQVALGETRELAGNIGYLRIPRMDPRIIPTTVEDIRKFRDTAAMVIDVRDNSGGSYALLHAIYGFFVPDDAKPYVTNIAAYRLSDQFRQDHINYRPTYRATWDGWSEAERAAIQAVARAFKPAWELPRDKFSEWHYMVLSRERGGQEYFYYDKPVAVLCNAGSFSATDGFLSAFADLPQVTLVGEPSGGGSGATRRFLLRNSGTIVALSSMASFRSNGRLFDGNGVDVDVQIKPNLADYLTDADSVLDRAVQLLQEKTRNVRNDPEDLGLGLPTTRTDSPPPNRCG